MWPPQNPGTVHDEIGADLAPLRFCDQRSSLLPLEGLDVLDLTGCAGLVFLRVSPGTTSFPKRGSLSGKDIGSLSNAVFKCSNNPIYIYIII